MYATRLPFGKHRGAVLPDVPTGYLRWLQRADRVDGWLLHEVNAELAQRGQRLVDAALLLRDLEEELTSLVSMDEGVCHGCAGALCDAVLEAFDEIRQRHGVSGRTLLECG